MNKKEVLEIRKQFSPENCAISKICGCYVDHEKVIKLEFRDAFLSLPEEEEFKYFDIFKHTLSGTLGKNLLNMEFPLEQEKPGGTQEFLMKLRNSKLEDEMLVSEFYEKVIQSYNYGENYYIILIDAAYDVPGKASDNLEMDDASDTVFHFILCSICPVKLSKAGLSYFAQDNTIAERVRDWVVEAPMTGFLFPVFNDRYTDIHNVLYYSKKPEELQEVFIEDVLGSRTPMTAVTQMETFQSLIEETLGEECEYEVVKNIHENLNEMIEETKDAPEPLELSAPDVKRLLEKSGVADEKMEAFDERFEEVAGPKASLLATNIANTKKFKIETPDIVIQVNPDCAQLIETRMIDGRQCLVIAVDEHLSVNGVNVKMAATKEKDGDSSDEV